MRDSGYEAKWIASNQTMPTDSTSRTTAETGIIIAANKAVEIDPLSVTVGVGVAMYEVVVPEGEFSIVSNDKTKTR